MFLALLFGSLVGLPLGLTGGGGSIFAVPLLVYGLGMDFRRAVAVSLAIVGLTALYGALLQIPKRQVHWRVGILLGVGGIVAVPCGAWIGAQLSTRVSLLLFAALMTAIGLNMLLPRKAGADGKASRFSCRKDSVGAVAFSPSCAAKLLAAGAVTGILSGMFGVGGGLLLIPAILLVAAVSIERAMATSLVAIFLIALSGFVANCGNLSAQDLWPASCFLAGSAVGMTGGTYLRGLLSARMLQKVFGGTVLATAAYVVIKNLH